MVDLGDHRDAAAVVHAERDVEVARNVPVRPFSIVRPIVVRTVDVFRPGAARDLRASSACKTMARLPRRHGGTARNRCFDPAIEPTRRAASTA